MSDLDDARDGDTIPLTRDELVFNLTMGLDKARHMWPRRRADQDQIRMKIIVDHVADHLERCNVRCYRRRPPPDRPRPPLPPWGDLRPAHARLIREEQRMLDARFGRRPPGPEDGGTPPATEARLAAAGATPTTPTRAKRSTKP